MDCDRCQGSFAAAIEGLLDPADQPTFAAHLGTCPGCSAAFDATRWVVARLQAHAKRGAVPALADRVEARIIRDQALQLRKVALMRRRIFRFSAAAALLAGAGLATALLWSPAGRPVQADDVRSADRAIAGVRTATWRTSFYQRFDERGGPRSRWLRIKNNEQRLFFKAPGMYRREDLDDAGNVIYVSIEDLARKAKLDINHRARTAKLVFLADPSHSPLGPFATFRGSLREDKLVSLGKRAEGGRELEGFRHAFYVERAGEPWSYDFWVDARTKQLAAQQVPGADIFPPADVFAGKLYDVEAKDWNTATIDGAPFDVSLTRGMAVGGFRLHDVALDVPLGDDLFAMTAPEGYKAEAAQLPIVAEADVTDFLRLEAGYFGGTFPANPLAPIQGAVEHARYARVEQDMLAGKKEAGTPGEVAYIAANRSWMNKMIPGPGPLNLFVYHRIEQGSWKYLGEGVKLGDKDRTVCWYRPLGSKDYHVVLGDLSGKVVAPADLPLPVAR